MMNLFDIHTKSTNETAGILPCNFIIVALVFVALFCCSKVLDLYGNLNVVFYSQIRTRLFKNIGHSNLK